MVSSNDSIKQDIWATACSVDDTWIKSNSDDFHNFFA